jgi:hypothetical protein
MTVAKRVSSLPLFLQPGIPAPERPPRHSGPGHPIAIFPGGTRVCVDHQKAEPCLCGRWIVADEGFEVEAVTEHQQTPEHRAWCIARYGPRHTHRPPAADVAS